MDLYSHCAHYALSLSGVHLWCFLCSLHLKLSCALGVSVWRKPQKKKKISGLEPGGRRGQSVCFRVSWRATHFFPCGFPMFFLLFILFPSFVQMCSYFCVCFPIFLRHVCDFRFKLPPPKKKTHFLTSPPTPTRGGLPQTPPAPLNPP